jgi:DNA-binding MarR family transcriptional regulator
MGTGGTVEYPIPTLMRSARGVYARSIRAQLKAIGVDDIPKNGAFVLAGIDESGGPRNDLHSELGVTKQAVSQVLDILVVRGYLERRPDADDRRRIALDLTYSGLQVLEAVARGVEAVDDELRERVSQEQIEAMRSVLLALTEIKASSATKGVGRKRPARQLRKFSPIFPVSDLSRALAHYADLGFVTFSYEEGSEYGFADRDGCGVHLAADSHADPARTASAYLYVADADALYEEWSRRA